MFNLHLPFRPINIQRPMRMFSDIRYQRLQNLVWMFFQQLFMPISKRPFTTQWQQCGQAWKLSMSFPFRTELVAENTFFGTQQAEWKERLWVESVLEENIRTVPFTTGGILRLLCVGIFIQSFERRESGTVLQLPARKLYWCTLHFSFACLVRTYCVIIE